MKNSCAVILGSSPLLLVRLSSISVFLSVFLSCLLVPPCPHLYSIPSSSLPLQPDINQSISPINTQRTDLCRNSPTLQQWCVSSVAPCPSRTRSRISRQSLPRSLTTPAPSASPPAPTLSSPSSGLHRRARELVVQRLIKPNLGLAVHRLGTAQGRPRVPGRHPPAPSDPRNPLPTPPAHREAPRRSPPLRGRLRDLPDLYHGAQGRASGRSGSREEEG